MLNLLPHKKTDKSHRHPEIDAWWQAGWGGHSLWIIENQQVSWWRGTDQSELSFPPHSHSVTRCSELNAAAVANYCRLLFAVSEIFIWRSEIINLEKKNLQFLHFSFIALENKRQSSKNLTFHRQWQSAFIRAIRLITQLIFFELILYYNIIIFLFVPPETGQWPDNQVKVKHSEKAARTFNLNHQVFAFTLFVQKKM